MDKCIKEDMNIILYFCYYFYVYDQNRLFKKHITYF